MRWAVSIDKILAYKSKNILLRTMSWFLYLCWKP